MMFTRYRRAGLRWLSCLTLCLVGASRANDDLVVQKSAGQSNPRLHLKQFTGPSAVRERLLSDLNFSNWLSVSENAGEADYLAEVTVTERAGDNQVSLTLTDHLGNPLGTLNQRGDYPAVHLARSAVDGLITRLFKAPGPCHTRLAFVRQEGQNKEIWLADFDGGNAKRITHNKSLSVEPAWSPTGRYLVYTAYGSDHTALALLEVAADRQRVLLQQPGLNAGAAFSPDGRTLATVLSRDNQVDLYRVDLATNALTRLTNTVGGEASPTWSPDQKQLCLSYDAGGTRPTLYLVPAAGGTPERLLPMPEEAASPDWSPVSNRIAFSLRRGGQYVIAMVDFRLADRTPIILTNGPGDWESPSWSADGRHLVCSRTLDGQARLVLVDSYYGRVLPLKTGASQDSLPAYSPK